jgi:hypothetical protein
LGEAVQEDPAETLESDDLHSDPLDAGYVPPDRLSPATRTQPDAEPAGRSLDERVAEEERDIDPEEMPSSAEEQRAGRLIDTDYGDDTYADDAGLAGGASSAEEAAVQERRSG